MKSAVSRYGLAWLLVFSLSGSGQSLDYDYSERGEQISVKSPDGERHYGYDESGNRVVLNDFVSKVSLRIHSESFLVVDNGDSSLTLEGLIETNQSSVETRLLWGESKSELNQSTQWRQHPSGKMLSLSDLVPLRDYFYRIESRVAGLVERSGIGQIRLRDPVSESLSLDLHQISLVDDLLRLSATVSSSVADAQGGLQLELETRGHALLASFPVGFDTEREDSHRLRTPTFELAANGVRSFEIDVNLVPGGLAIISGDLRRSGVSIDGSRSSHFISVLVPPRDTDGDGVSDREDLDDDGDGISDDSELSLGLEPLVDDNLLDTDGDFFSNRQEFDAGTDPFDGGSFPRLGFECGWEYISPAPFATLLTDVAWGDGRTVVVGGAGQILYRNNLSEDWMSAASPFTRLSRRVAWTGERFITTNQSGLAVSENGRDWRVITREIGFDALGANESGVWMAVPSSGTGQIWESLDRGMNWMIRNLTEPLPDCLSLGFGNGLWVWVSENAILVSENRLDWEEVLVGDGLELASVYWDGRGFTVTSLLGADLAEGNQIWESQDGKIWASSYQGLVVVHLATDGARKVGVGGGYFPSDDPRKYLRLLQSSSDDATWLSRQEIAPPLNRVRFLNGEFVAVGALGSYLTSEDGEEWTERTVRPTTSDLNNINVIGQRLFAVGDDGTLMVSDDGLDWLTKPISRLGALNGIDGNDQAIVAVGDGGVIFRSVDQGDTWGEVANQTLVDLRGVFHGAGEFFAFGGDSKNPVILASKDGLIWRQENIKDLVASAENTSGLLEYGAGLADRVLVGGLYFPTLLRDDHGNWSLLSERFRSVAVYQGQFMGVDVRGSYLGDGLSWKALDIASWNWWPGQSSLRSPMRLVSSPREIIAMDPVGAISISLDGKFWQTTDLPIANSRLLSDEIRAVAFYRDRIYIVGTDGLIIREDLGCPVFDVSPGGVLQRDILEPIGLSFTIENRGRQVATAINVQYPLPEGFEFRSASLLSNASHNYDESNREIRWTVDLLDPGEQIVLDLDLEISQSAFQSRYPGQDRVVLSNRLIVFSSDLPAGRDLIERSHSILVYHPDLDIDGVLWDEDNAPLNPNPDQLDTDGDGVGDVVDEDDDNDGMSDTFERVYSLNPLFAGDAVEDTDRDGYSNRDEGVAGTDPTDADSRPFSVLERGFDWVYPMPTARDLSSMVSGGRITLIFTEQGEYLRMEGGKLETLSFPTSLSGGHQAFFRDGVFYVTESHVIGFTVIRAFSSRDGRHWVEVDAQEVPAVREAFDLIVPDALSFSSVSRGPTGFVGVASGNQFYFSETGESWEKVYEAIQDGQAARVHSVEYTGHQFIAWNPNRYSSNGQYSARSLFWSVDGRQWYSASVEIRADLSVMDSDGFRTIIGTEEPAFSSEGRGIGGLVEQEAAVYSFVEGGGQLGQWGVSTKSWVTRSVDSGFSGANGQPVAFFSGRLFTFDPARQAVLSLGRSGVDLRVEFQIETSTVTAMCATKDALYFCSDGKLYSYGGGQESPERLPIPDGFVFYGLASDGSHLWWCDRERGVIGSYDLEQNLSAEVVKVEFEPHTLAIDSSQGMLFVSDPTLQKVYSVNIRRAAPKALPVLEGVEARQLQTYGSRLYWVDVVQGELSSVLVRNEELLGRESHRQSQSDPFFCFGPSSEWRWIDMASSEFFEDWLGRNGSNTLRDILSVAIDSQYAYVGYRGGLLLGAASGESFHQLGNWNGRSLEDITEWNGRFFGAGSNGNLMVSEDGFDWRTIDAGINPREATVDFLSITAGNNRVLAVGNGAPSDRVVLNLNSDEAVWQYPEAHPSLPIRAAAFGNNRFVVVGDHNLVLTSLDGLVWSEYPLVAGADTTAESATNIVFGNGNFLANRGGVLYLSSDGETWQKIILSQGVEEFLWNGSRWFGFAGNQRWTSSDGLDWEVATMDWSFSGERPHNDSNAASFTWDGRRLIAHDGKGNLLTSSDGLLWELVYDRFQRLGRLDWMDGEVWFFPGQSNFLTGTRSGVMRQIRNRSPELISTESFIVQAKDGATIDFSSLPIRDLDVPERLRYEFVPGPGDQDNSRFEIVSDRLVTRAGAGLASIERGSFRVRVTDGLGELLETPLEFEVNRMPEFSELAETRYILEEDTPYTFQISGFDPEGSGLEWSIARFPDAGNLTIEELVGDKARFGYMPHPNVFGEDSAVVRIEDGRGGFQELELLFSINSVIDPVELVVRGGGHPILDGDEMSSRLNLTDFGGVEIGKGVWHTFSVTNRGELPFRLDHLYLPGGFHLVEELDSVLSPGETETFTVGLSILEPQDVTGWIRIESRDLLRGSFEFSVSGRGISTAFSELAEIGAQGAHNINGWLYFVGRDELTGNELWRTDGTAEGTERITDIIPGPKSSVNRILGNLGEIILLQANDGEHGFELFRSDGTAEGTSLLVDIRPGSSPSGVSLLGKLGGWLFFSATDGNSGRELWRTDGTPEGTSMVKEINSVEGEAANPMFGAVNEGLLYFSAEDGVHGRELWKTDGTSEGTVMVRDLWPGPVGSTPGFLKHWAGGLVFVATTPGTGEEPWVSDGSSEGTRLVEDIQAGASSSISKQFVAVGETVFFEADDQIHGSELWVMNDGANGARLVEDIAPERGRGIYQVSGALGSQLVFIANGGIEGRKLWISDGSERGTFSLMDRVESSDPPHSGNLPTYWVSKGEWAYFAGYDASHGAQVWRTDGTIAGTSRISDFGSEDRSRTLSFVGKDERSLYFQKYEEDTNASLHRIDLSSGNAGPRIGSIKNLNFDVGSGPIEVLFEVAEAENIEDTLSVEVRSDNSFLLPDDRIRVQPTGNAWSLRLDPMPAMFGGAVVTVIASQGGLKSSSSFVLSVTEQIATPLLGELPDYIVNVSDAVRAVPIPLNAAFSELSEVRFTIDSSNPGLIEFEDILIEQNDGNYQLVVKPLSGRAGSSILKLGVELGGVGQERSFRYSVLPDPLGPSISRIEDTTIFPPTKATASHLQINLSYRRVEFSVQHPELIPELLNVEVFSSNSTLLPKEGLVLGGTAENRSLTLIPAAQETGEALVTIRVSDGVQSVTESFLARMGAQSLEAVDGNLSFGSAVALGDGIAAIGAPAAILGEESSAAVTIVKRNAIGRWDVADQLHGSDARSNHGFGNSLSIDGNNLLIGTPNFSLPDEAIGGAVYLFERASIDSPYKEASRWQPLQVENRVGARFGQALQIADGLAVIGAPGAGPEGSGFGSVYVFALNEETKSWEQEARLEGFEFNSFGNVVAIAQGQVLVRHPSGIILYRRNDEGLWKKADTLVPSGFRSNDNFGGSIAVHSGQVAIGSSWVESRKGAAFVFDLNGQGTWNELSKIGSEFIRSETRFFGNFQPGSLFGANVAIGKDLVAVSSENVGSRDGRVSLFWPNPVDGAWNEERVFFAPDLEDWKKYGRSMVYHSETLLIGADGRVQFIDLSDSSSMGFEIAPIADVNVNEDVERIQVPIELSGDLEDLVGVLVTAVTSGSELIEELSVVSEGDGRRWNLNGVLPPRTSGDAIISVIVEKGNRTTTESFRLRVEAVERPPILDLPTKWVVDEGAVAVRIPFAVADEETEPKALQVRVVADNPDLLPVGSLTVQGDAEERILSVEVDKEKFGKATILVSLDDGSLVVSQSMEFEVLPVNDSPELAPLNDIDMFEDGFLRDVLVYISDIETPAEELLVGVDSTNRQLLPLGSLELTGDRDQRSLSIRPAKDQFGTAVIRVSVDDGDLIVAETFVLSVISVNEAPMMRAIENQKILEDQVLGPLELGLSDEETLADDLEISVRSNNAQLVSGDGLQVVRDLGGQAVMITPEADAFGAAIIHLNISDGENSLSQSFALEVTSVNDPPIITAPHALLLEPGTVQKVSINVEDVDSPAQDLTLVAIASSSDPLSLEDFSLAKQEDAWELTLSPNAAASRESVLILRASDGIASIDQSISISTATSNTPPFIVPLPSFEIGVGQTLTIGFVVLDGEASGNNLSVFATSLDPDLVAQSGLTLGGQGAGRSLTIVPVPGQSGIVGVQLEVMDSGGLTGSEILEIKIGDDSQSLAVNLDGDAIVLRWEGAGKLQRANDIVGPFEVIPNASSPYKETLSGQSRFYKLSR